MNCDRKISNAPLPTPRSAAARAVRHANRVLRLRRELTRGGYPRAQALAEVASALHRELCAASRYV